MFITFDFFLSIVVTSMIAPSSVSKSVWPRKVLEGKGEEGRSLTQEECVEGALKMPESQYYFSVTTLKTQHETGHTTIDLEVKLL